MVLRVDKGSVNIPWDGRSTLNHSIRKGTKDKEFRFGLDSGLRPIARLAA